MKEKFLQLNDPLYRYLCSHRSDANDPILNQLREETALLGEEAEMQISREQGSFFSILVAALGARSAIEVGTFTGYSSLCIARALPNEGRLVCIDSSDQWTQIARKYWLLAGVEKKIDLRLGDALSILKQLEPGRIFDFAFIDADKTEYDAYYELILPRMKNNGILVFDNMLWGGRFGSGPIEEEKGRALHELNQKLANDPRVECALLPIADGLQFCRKR